MEEDPEHKFEVDDYYQELLFISEILVATHAHPCFMQLKKTLTCRLVSPEVYVNTFLMNRIRNNGQSRIK